MVNLPFRAFHPRVIQCPRPQYGMQCSFLGCIFHSICVVYRPPVAPYVENSGRIPPAVSEGRAPITSSTDFPDPQDSEASLDPLSAQLHPHWFIRCILILVAFLHTRHQVSFRACGLILVCLNFIFLRLPGDLLLPGDPMPVTLKTVFSRLGLQGDRFTQYILCYQCHRLFDRHIPSDTLCPDCGIELFQPATRQLFESVVSTITGTPTPESSRRPHLVAPVQLLSDSLREFFQRPGMIAAVNLWKVRPRTSGESRSIQDGEVWRTIKGSDGQSFFFGESSEREIRLGTTIGLDWHVSPSYSATFLLRISRFGRKTSSYGPSHSSGVMSTCIQNLLESERYGFYESSFPILICHEYRYRAENLILHGMPPGPTEPNADQLQHHLKVVVDELILLYDKGIVIKTPEYPNGMYMTAH